MFLLFVIIISLCFSRGTDISEVKTTYNVQRNIQLGLRLFARNLSLVFSWFFLCYRDDNHLLSSFLLLFLFRFIILLIVFLMVATPSSVTMVRERAHTLTAGFLTGRHTNYTLCHIVIRAMTLQDTTYNPRVVLCTCLLRIAALTSQRSY